jgi:hypothetical protein
MDYGWHALDANHGPAGGWPESAFVVDKKVEQKAYRNANTMTFLAWLLSAVLGGLYRRRSQGAPMVYGWHTLD